MAFARQGAKEQGGAMMLVAGFSLPIAQSLLPRQSGVMPSMTLEIRPLLEMSAVVTGSKSLARISTSRRSAASGARASPG
jgi:hypothetical protein